MAFNVLFRNGSARPRWSKLVIIPRLVRSVVYPVVEPAAFDPLIDLLAHLPSFSLLCVLPHSGRINCSFFLGPLTGDTSALC